MGQRMIKRRLAATSKRLTTLRSELDVVREQLPHLHDDAEDEEIRAVVADNTGQSRDARRAREHVHAMQRHHDEIVAEIGRLELRQDELLDELTSAG